MVLACFILAVICCALSALSRSAIKWAALMLFGASASFSLGVTGHHSMIWLIDLFMLLAMVGMRQDMNRDWQDGVAIMQVLVTTSYMMFALFSGSVSWLIYPLIDASNVLYLVQLALVSFGGVRNGRRNLAYTRAKSIRDETPWHRMALRMMS